LWGRPCVAHDHFTTFALICSPQTWAPGAVGWGWGEFVGKRWEQLEGITEHNYCLRMATSGKQLCTGFKTALMKNGTLCWEWWGEGRWWGKKRSALLSNMVGMKRQQRKQQAGYKIKSGGKKVLTKEGWQRCRFFRERHLKPLYFCHLETWTSIWSGPFTHWSSRSIYVWCEIFVLSGRFPTKRKYTNST
jgi:hypothetical protein